MPKGQHFRKLSDEQRLEIVTMYTTPNPDGTWVGVTTIARHFGVRHATIDNVLAKFGVPKRSMKQAHAHGKRCKPLTRLPQSDPPLCRCGCGGRTEWSPAGRRWRAFIKGHRMVHVSREWLVHQYVELGRTCRAIAQQLGVGKKLILSALHRYQIPMRTARESLILTGNVAGNKNPAWRGGTTPERQLLYKKRQWKDTVKAVLKRDNYTCQRCGSGKVGGRILHTHHIKPFATHPDLRFEPSNLVTLCSDCHVWVHSNQNTSGLFK